VDVWDQVATAETVSEITVLPSTTIPSKEAND